MKSPGRWKLTLGGYKHSGNSLAQKVRTPGKISTADGKEQVGFVKTTVCGGGFAISPRIILPRSLEWQCCFLGGGSSTALVVQFLSRVRLCDPVDYRCQAPPALHYLSEGYLWTLYVFTCTHFTAFWMDICSKVHVVSHVQLRKGPWAPRGRRPRRRCVWEVCSFHSRHCCWFCLLAYRNWLLRVLI